MANKPLPHAFAHALLAAAFLALVPVSASAIALTPAWGPNAGKKLPPPNVQEGPALPFPRGGENLLPQVPSRGPGNSELRKGRSDTIDIPLKAHPAQ